jgi:hypothetical protein
MSVRNEQNRVGWAACALARHVDALVVRDDASDDGTGTYSFTVFGVTKYSGMRVPSPLLTCPSLLLYSGGAFASAAALRF